MFSKFNAYNTNAHARARARTHTHTQTQTHTHTHARTHTHTRTRARARAHPQPHGKATDWRGGFLANTVKLLFWTPPWIPSKSGLKRRVVPLIQRLVWKQLWREDLNKNALKGVWWWGWGVSGACWSVVSERCAPQSLLSYWWVNMKLQASFIYIYRHEWVSETLYIRISTQNMVCSQCQVHTCIHHSVTHSYRESTEILRNWQKQREHRDTAMGPQAVKDAMRVVALRDHWNNQNWQGPVRNLGYGEICCLRDHYSAEQGPLQYWAGTTTVLNRDHYSAEQGPLQYWAGTTTVLNRDHYIAEQGPLQYWAGTTTVLSRDHYSTEHLPESVQASLGLDPNT